MSTTLTRCWDAPNSKHIYTDGSCSYDECWNVATQEHGVYCDSTFFARCWDIVLANWKVSVTCCTTPTPTPTPTPYSDDCSACGTVYATHSAIIGNCGGLGASSTSLAFGSNCSVRYGNIVLSRDASGYWTFAHHRTSPYYGNIVYRSTTTAACPLGLVFSFYSWRCDAPTTGSLTINTPLVICGSSPCS